MDRAGARRERLAWEEGEEQHLRRRCGRRGACVAPGRRQAARPFVGILHLACVYSTCGGRRTRPRDDVNTRVYILVVSSLGGPRPRPLLGLGCLAPSRCPSLALAHTQNSRWSSLTERPWVELRKTPLGGELRKRCGRAASTPALRGTRGDQVGGWRASGRVAGGRVASGRQAQVGRRVGGRGKWGGERAAGASGEAGGQAQSGEAGGRQARRAGRT